MCVCPPKWISHYVPVTLVYSSRQFIDDQVHGVTGNNIGAYMIIPGTGYEGSSGGPFFRDINNQGGKERSAAQTPARKNDELSQATNRNYTTVSHKNFHRITPCKLLC